MATPTPQALAAELASLRQGEDNRVIAQDRRIESYRGLGGYEPEARYQPRTDAELIVEARKNIADREAFHASDEGKCLAELREMEERACAAQDLDAVMLVGSAMAARARDYSGERSDIEAMMAQARALLAPSPSPVSARQRAA